MMIRRERDPYWEPTADAPHHRCDTRWLVASGGGTLYAESPAAMYFRFTSRKRRAEMEARLFRKCIKSVKFTGRVLVVVVAALAEGDCEECDTGITKEIDDAHCGA